MMTLVLLITQILVDSTGICGKVTEVNDEQCQLVEMSLHVLRKRKHSGI